MNRREFLKAGLALGGLAMTNAVWRGAFAAPATDALPLYGPTPDANGFLLPPGYSSRAIARGLRPVIGASGLPVGDPGYVFPIFPDGSAVFADTDPGNAGGWILVVNSENPPPPDARIAPAGIQEQFGGATAVRFSSSGDVIDAYWVLRGTQTNCAGGATPWGTWLSCEEFDNSIRFGATSDAGRVWECSPQRGQPAVVHEALGRFKHEAAAFDDQGRVYLTEDVGDGLFYRFTPATSPGTPASLASGTLAAWAGNGNGGAGSWVPIGDPSASSASTRAQGLAAGATTFSGGEGAAFAPHASGGGRVYFTTKGDDKVRAVDTQTGALEVVYPSPATASPALKGVDNVVYSASGKLYVAEDGDDMELVRIEGITTGSPVARPFLRLTGAAQGLVGVPYPGPVPLESEITGPCVSPDGTRLYLASQREGVFGALYEIKAPTGASF